MKIAVVGHVEWVDFARVERVPAAGEIVHASEVWAEPAGGGAVAAVQLAKLGGEAVFFTALGEDELGRRSREQLIRQGVRVHAAHRPGGQRRAFTFVDATGERTITVLGDKLVARAADPLPWVELADADAVLFVSGDTGALEAARRARIVVATARELETLRSANVPLDVLLTSAGDPGERYRPGELDPPPGTVVTTEGAAGGRSEPGGNYSAAAVPGPVSDTYGCGDSFAAGLTFALARGDELPQALELAARCGAAVAAGRGPYSSQLRL